MPSSRRCVPAHSRPPLRERARGLRGSLLNHRGTYPAAALRNPGVTFRVPCFAGVAAEQTASVPTLVYRDGALSRTIFDRRGSSTPRPRTSCRSTRPL
jgi:hypothetical protein